MSHTFHIPVLGLGYSVDTPLKVARYGISSVMSIVDDELVERMRRYHAERNGQEFVPIPKQAPDARAERITAYLNLVHSLVNQQIDELKTQPFEPWTDLTRYFELLPESSQLRQGYDLMMEFEDGERKRIFQNLLRNMLKKGSIDVNIMAKVDKMNFDADGNYLGDENTDALSALRGFAKSNLCSSVILSAGMNPRLYAYLETFTAFYPREDGTLDKKIILKVSDYRSAFIQAKFLAKKGLWVSEFRVESGLNCGGHAFATDGFLLGPILEEFKQKRQDMLNELSGLYITALAGKNITIHQVPAQHVTVQGGIGTNQENSFLLNYYQLDATGWGSPFLLVPEVTNVDDDTLQSLTTATPNDFYVSNASPLGVPFNNFKKSSMESLRLQRLERGRPGSPCTKKYLCSNTEFTEQPICTASREYQHHKLAQLKAEELPPELYEQQVNAITQKVCLCEGLCASTYMKYSMLKPRESKAVSICPGPNLAYFNRTYTLDEMVKHIYGKINLLDKVNRPHMFVKELGLYVEHLQNTLQTQLQDWTDKKAKHTLQFKAQLQEGINYYKKLFTGLSAQATGLFEAAQQELLQFEKQLQQLEITGTASQPNAV